MHKDEAKQIINKAIKGNFPAVNAMGADFLFIAEIIVNNKEGFAQFSREVNGTLEKVVVKK